MSKLQTADEAKADGYEVIHEPQSRRVWQLSTHHVDGDEQRVHWALSGEHPLIISLDHGDGWFVRVDRCWSPDEYREQLAKSQTPPCVTDVLVEAYKLGFEYVLLDGDAPCYAGLPIYAW